MNLKGVAPAYGTLSSFVRAAKEEKWSEFGHFFIIKSN